MYSRESLSFFALRLLNEAQLEILAFQRALKECVVSVDDAYGKSFEEFYVGFEGRYGRNFMP